MAKSSCYFSRKQLVSQEQVHRHVLERSDAVIVDNCGFHHGHFVEPILTALLANCGVRLLFQPPYSPEFNTCELCFHDIKKFL